MANAVKVNITIVLDSVNGEVTMPELSQQLSSAGYDVKVIPAADQSEDIWIVSRRKKNPKLL